MRSIGVWDQAIRWASLCLTCAVMERAFRAVTPTRRGCIGVWNPSQTSTGTVFQSICLSRAFVQFQAVLCFSVWFLRVGISSLCIWSRAWIQKEGSQSIGDEYNSGKCHLKTTWCHRDSGARHRLVRSWKKSLHQFVSRHFSINWPEHRTCTTPSFTKEMVIISIAFFGVISVFLFEGKINSFLNWLFTSKIVKGENKK